MDCDKLIEQRDFENGEQIQAIAKDTIQFLLKHNISLTPINYETWFYTFCKAREEGHILSEKNLFILYEKFIKELRKDRDRRKRELEEISKSLEKVTQESDNILKDFNNNINEHSEILDESLDALDTQDALKMSELKKRIKKLEIENKKLKEALEQNKKRLQIVEAKFSETKKAADIDSLTKVFNRQRFDKDIENIDKSCDTYSVIFIDIDNFKAINDTYGHAVGDKVLQEMGEILNNFLRKNTYAYRYGGEEFVVILPDANIQEAHGLANRLKEVIENRTVKIADQKFLTFTASFGVAQKQKGENFEDVLKRADEALYEAKRTGKNRVVLK